MKTTIIKFTTFSAILVLIFGFSLQISAQDSTVVDAAPVKKKADKPVRAPWGAGMLIETQTDLVWAPKTLEFVIQHRFGNLNSGSFDLGGLYAPSNIRIAFNYGLFKNFNVGIGTTKDNMYQDVNVKYKILTQTKSNSMPIGMAYYGNVAMNATPEANFGNNYSFSNRLSYFNQLIISRKFTKDLTMQVSFSYAHFNQIDTIQSDFADLKHDNFGFGIAGRYKIGKTSSIMFEYDQALTTPEVIKPNISLGIELGTSAHAFQIFVTTYRGIVYQDNMVYNRNDFTDFDNPSGWGILLGFNMTRNWNF